MWTNIITCDTSEFISSIHSKDGILVCSLPNMFFARKREKTRPKFVGILFGFGWIE